MAEVRPTDAAMFCDPGPCDPWKLDLFARDYDWWVLLLFLVTALLAGLNARRSNWKLPVASMSMIAVAVYLELAGTMKLQWLHLTHLAGPGGKLSNADLRSMDQLRAHEMELAAVGLLGFALVPFLIGLVISAVRRRRFSADATQSLLGDVA